LPLTDAFQEQENALLEQRCCFGVKVAEAAIGEQVAVAWIEKELGGFHLLDELADGGEVFLCPSSASIMWI
jgi:hypothetical protein